MKDYQLIYSQVFVDDLTKVLEHIAKESSHSAKIFERNLRKKIKLLKQFPEIGRTSDDPRLEGIRIFVVGNYLVLYEVLPGKESVYLHAFCHGARDYPNIYKSLPRE